jgi:hypothetical protein
MRARLPRRPDRFAVPSFLVQRIQRCLDLEFKQTGRVTDCQPTTDTKIQSIAGALQFAAEQRSNNGQTNFCIADAPGVPLYFRIVSSIEL